MQAVLVLLVVAGSSAWLALDASKRDWTDNSFAKNVPSWVVGSLLLWPIVFPLYLFVHRKNAPLREAPAKPEPAAAVATEAAGPSEQYGPAVDEVGAEEPHREPESVVEAAHEPAVEIARGPVIEFGAPEPVAHPEPIAQVEPDPVVVMEHEPVVEIQAEPEPIVELEQERVVEAQVQPEPVRELTPEPDPVVELEAEPVEQVEPQPEPEPIVEISHPEMPVEQAPPGLSVDAFKDIKPVAFGGAAIEDHPVEGPPAPEPDAAPAPEPDAAPEPSREPEPSAEPDVEKGEDVEPEPTFGIEPLPASHPDEEPTFEIKPPPADEPQAAVEPLSYPEFEAEATPEPTFEPEPTLEPEPEPAVAAATAEPAVERPKKRGFRIPNPELRLPSFGKRKKAAAPVTAAKAPTAKRGGIKMPQITLPANLQGPLSELERKIALVSVLGIVAAGALGFATAPSDDAAAPAPPPAPAATSR